MSLYTAKVRAYLKYKALPFDEVLATREEYRDVHSEVGALLGFADFSNFRRKFVKYAGMSPNQYRRAVRP